MKKKYTVPIILTTIVIIGLLFRIYDINWDQGFHLHPDEREIVMTTLPLTIPQTLSETLSIQSPLNPHFFAYGSLPIYLLKITAYGVSFINPLYNAYDKIQLVGRALSALIDCATITALYYLGKRATHSTTVSLIASFFYAIAVLPIQTSHFYVVDIPLTFFSIIILLLCSLYSEKPYIKNAIIIGIFFGLALATKISALPLALPIGMTFSYHLVKLFQKHLSYLAIKNILIQIMLFVITTVFVFLVCEPYAVIDFNSFLSQNIEQYQMTKNAFIFPYTLQYVGKIPYVYEITNVFFWGLGPIITTMAFIGIVILCYTMVKKHSKLRNYTMLCLGSFFLIYFAVVGKFAVGWMRYMLPLYPLFCLFAAVGAYMGFSWLASHIKNPRISQTKSISKLVILFIFFTAVLVWPLSFMHIYTQPHTRVLASNWISKHIKPGSILAEESWDDTLPLGNISPYTLVTLPMYDPDTPEKWLTINNMLARSNYIIISSNRAYVPLQKLTNCKKLPENRCYPLTAAFYSQLFKGELNFHKVAEFSMKPVIPFLNIPINDQRADESFTVYDHPTVMIFQKNNT